MLYFQYKSLPDEGLEYLSLWEQFSILPDKAYYEVMLDDRPRFDLHVYASKLVQEVGKSLSIAGGDFVNSKFAIYILWFTSITIKMYMSMNRFSEP